MSVGECRLYVELVERAGAELRGFTAWRIAQLFAFGPLGTICFHSIKVLILRQVFRTALCDDYDRILLNISHSDIGLTSKLYSSISPPSTSPHPFDFATLDTKSKHLRVAVGTCSVQFLRRNAIEDLPASISLSYHP